MKPELKDYARYFLRRAVHGAGWLVLWTFWLALAVLLYAQARIATSDEIVIPDAVLRNVEQRLAAQGLKLTFGSIHCDTAGNVVLRDVALFTTGFEDPIVTVRAARCSVNPYALLAHKIMPQAMRIDGGSLRLPAMFSADGTNAPVIADINADVALDGDTLLVKTLTARLENLTLLHRGAVTLPRSGRDEKTDTEILAEGISQYLKIARQVATLAPKLRALERPILDVTLTPDAQHMALARVTLTANSLHFLGRAASPNPARTSPDSHGGFGETALPADLGGQLALASGPLLAATSFDFGTLASAFEKGATMDACAGSGGLQTAGRGAPRLAIENHSDAQNQNGRDFVASGGLETAPPSQAAPPLRLDVTSESVQFAQTARARGVRLALTLPLAEASQLLQGNPAQAPAFDVLLRVASDSVTVFAPATPAASATPAALAASPAATPAASPISPIPPISPISPISRGITAHALTARISGQFPQNLRAEITAALFATPVSLEATGANLDDKSATLAISTQATPRHIAEISRIAGIDLGAILKPARPIDIDATARLDAGWRLASATGDVDTGAILAYGVPVDRARGTFVFDNTATARTMTFSPALAVIGESRARGSFTTNLDTRAFRFLLKGALRPPVITPWLGSWWADFWNDFTFTGPAPLGDVDVQGAWETDGRSKVFIGADATRLTYNKVAFERARLTLFVMPDFVDALNVFVTRADGGSARGVFTYDTRGATTTTTLNFTAKNIDPIAIAPAISPEVAEGLAGLKLDKPLTLVRAAGRISERHEAPAWYHSRLDVDAEGDGAFTYEQIPLTGLSTRILMRDDDIVFEKLDTQIAGGRLNVSAQVYGPPDKRRLGFTLKLAQADLGNIVGIARAFTTSGTAAPAGAGASASATTSTSTGAGATTSASTTASASAPASATASASAPTTASASAPATAPASKTDSPLEAQLAGDLLTLRATADGPADNWLGFQGAGTVEITGANLLKINVLGALSRALSSVPGLNFSTISVNAAQASFSIDGARVNVPDAILTGSRALIKLNGDYALDTRHTDITARVYPLSATRNIIGRGLGVLLVPFSHLTELKFSGPIESPQWRFSYGPTSLFRALSGKPSNKNPGAPPAPGAPDLVSPPALEPEPEPESLIRIFGQPPPQ